jgi:glutamate synthase (NADPH) small chain
MMTLPVKRRGILFMNLQTPGINPQTASDTPLIELKDMRRGQSLVVWAIREGRQAARAVDEFLMGFSDLPR